MTADALHEAGGRQELSPDASGHLLTFPSGRAPQLECDTLAPISASFCALTGAPLEVPPEALHHTSRHRSIITVAEPEAPSPG
jgi:hypothetical protein